MSETMTINSIITKYIKDWVKKQARSLLGSEKLPETGVGDVKEGDVVMLKSGGPRMTVVKKGTDSCRCKWFSTEKLCDEIFATHALKKV